MGSTRETETNRWDSLIQLSVYIIYWEDHKCGTSGHNPDNKNWTELSTIDTVKELKTIRAFLSIEETPLTKKHWQVQRYKWQHSIVPKTANKHRLQTDQVYACDDSTHQCLCARIRARAAQLYNTPTARCDHIVSNHGNSVSTATCN